MVARWERQAWRRGGAWSILRRGCGPGASMCRATMGCAMPPHRCLSFRAWMAASASAAVPSVTRPQPFVVGASYTTMVSSRGGGANVRSGLSRMAACIVFARPRPGLQSLLSMHPCSAVVASTPAVLVPPSSSHGRHRLPQHSRGARECAHLISPEQVRMDHTAVGGKEQLHVCLR